MKAYKQDFLVNKEVLERTRMGEDNKGKERMLMVYKDQSAYALSKEILKDLTFEEKELNPMTTHYSIEAVVYTREEFERMMLAFRRLSNCCSMLTVVNRSSMLSGLLDDMNRALTGIEPQPQIIKPIYPQDKMGTDREEG